MSCGSTRPSAIWEPALKAQRVRSVWKDARASSRGIVAIVSLTANHSGGPGWRVSTHAQAVAFGEDILREEMSLHDRAALIEHRGCDERADVRGAARRL